MCHNLHFGRQVPCWLLITTGLVLIVVAATLLLSSATPPLASPPTQHQIVQVVQAVSRLQDCTICHAQPAQVSPPVARSLHPAVAAQSEPAPPVHQAIRQPDQETTTPLHIRLAGVGQRLLDVADKGMPVRGVSQAMDDFLTLTATVATGDPGQESATILQQIMALEARLIDLEQRAQAAQRWKTRTGPILPPHALALHANGMSVFPVLVTEPVERLAPPPAKGSVLADLGVHDSAQGAFSQSRRGPPAITSTKALIVSLERGLSPPRCAISFYV